MSGGDEWRPDDPDWSPPGGGGPWQHPSEVGLEVRGRSDRRRSSLVAAGVVIGGLGLLVSSLALGSMDDQAPAPHSTLPAQRAERSVAAVTVMDADGNSSRATAAVIDRSGHLVVDARALDGADEVWAQCSGDDMQQATMVATDESSNLAVLRLAVPSGVPASVTSALTSGDELLVMDAGDTTPDPDAWVVTTRVADLVTTNAGPPVRRFVAEAAPADPDTTEAPAPGSMAFDQSGDLAGIVVSSAGSGSVTVVSAADALDRADQMVDDQP